jgi:hypothetical protein
LRRKRKSVSPLKRLKLEEKKAELVEKYDKLMEKAGSVPQDELEADKKNIEESEKIVAFLKKRRTRRSVIKPKV